ncbi:hypothetical protein LguiA_015648 [Lonicera macranthoides]
MAKIHPKIPTTTTSSSSSNNYMTSTRETFTVWMKSLVFHGNGCTVFDSNGQIVYRVDNYDKKCSGKVYLMDLRGRVLFSIQRKRLQLLRGWDGYKWSGSSEVKKDKPWFRVREDVKNNLRGNMSFNVLLGCTDHKSNNGKGRQYRIIKLAGKSSFRVIDSDDGLVAEVMQKQTRKGVELGEDVLTLVVEPKVDHSLVMALVTVYGLINNKL